MVTVIVQIDLPVKYGPATFGIPFTVLPPPPPPPPIVTPLLKGTVDKASYNTGDKMIVTGTITDPDGITPLPGRTVSAASPGFSAVGAPTGISDATGKFIISGIDLLPAASLTNGTATLHFNGDP